MLLGSLQLLLDDPTSFLRLAVLVILSLIIAITVHEFSHALVATGLGDSTAKQQGRLSLNPMRHLDPGGTMLMLLAGFGWGKPVPVNLHRLAHGATGTSLVAAASPLSNLILAFLLAIPIKLGLLDYTGLGLYRITTVTNGGVLGGLSDLVSLVIFFNLLLAVFNLIPLAPLDGSRMLGGIMPGRRQASYDRFQRYGPVLLVGIVMLDYALGFGILWTVIGPIVSGLTFVATGI